MNKKRKISIRKVVQVLVTLIVTTGCVIAISSASNKEIVKNITGVSISIKNDQYHFIDKVEIKNMLFANRHIDIMSTPVNKLDIRSMERIVAANPWVASAQIYVDNKRTLRVNIVQRVPVARIFEETGNSYYIDSTMSMMPISSKYVYYTTVVTGVPVLKDDSIGKSLMGQIAGLVKYIERDTFWNAQVSQIIMMPDRSFELVPVLGGQRILFGDTTSTAEKFDNLFAFYRGIMNKIGWDKYEVLDLRYKNQVVASPAIPWKGPADKAMSDMSWVNSIMTMAAKDKPPVIFDTTQKTAITSTSETPKATALTASVSKVENQVAKQPSAKSFVGPVEDKHMVKPTVQPPPKAVKPTSGSLVKVKPVIGPVEDKPAVKASAAVKASKQGTKLAEQKKATAKKKESKTVKLQVQAKTTKVKAKLPETRSAVKRAIDKKETKVEKKVEKPEQIKEENKQQTPKYIYQNNNH